MKDSELQISYATEQSEVANIRQTFKNRKSKKISEIYPWLSDVMILENYRGKGYGKLLLKYAEEILKELGYKTIYVWTDQAPDFYKKLGFTYKQEVEKNEGGFGQLFYKEI